MAFVIRTIPSKGRRTLYYNACGAPEWQPGLPGMYANYERAKEDLTELKKKWEEIEIVSSDTL